MKLGFFLRRKEIYIENFIRYSLLLIDYLLWLFLSPSKFSGLPKLKRVLVIDTGGLGDCLNTYCIIQKLRQDYKKISFYYATNKKFQEAIKHFDDKLVDYDDKGNLSQNDFDMVISVVHKRINIRRIKTKFIIGMETEGFSSVFKFDSFLMARRIFPKYQHKIIERFKIFEKAGFKFRDYNLIFPEIKENKLPAIKLAKSLSLSQDDKIAFVNISSGTSTKAKKENKVPSHDWPIEYYKELVNRLLEDKKIKVIITGMKDEEKESSAILSSAKDRKRVFSIIGKLSFLELGEFMKSFKSAILVSIDTGTIHLATSFNIPVIDLIGPYDPKLYCAWNPSSNKAISLFNPGDCSKCRKYACPEGNNICMRNISAEEVYEIYKEMADD